tara:strand:+ start:10984 stop:11484 length:501 start_codon:yes stop_codon:yes gene_type:complete
MKTLMLATAVLLAAPAVQAGMKTTCTHGEQTRIIEVVYTGEGVVPCEVQYTKAEGTQTLWSASNMAGYCEEKAADFVEKQRGWGWECETEMSDDMQQTIDESVQTADEQSTDPDTAVDSADSDEVMEASDSAEEAPADESMDDVSSTEASDAEAEEAAPASPVIAD